jgi:hypothetical protein
MKEQVVWGIFCKMLEDRLQDPASSPAAEPRRRVLVSLTNIAVKCFEVEVELAYLTRRWRMGEKVDQFRPS